MVTYCYTNLYLQFQKVIYLTYTVLIVAIKKVFLDFFWCTGMADIGIVYFNWMVSVISLISVVGMAHFLCFITQSNVHNSMSTLCKDRIVIKQISLKITIILFNVISLLIIGFICTYLQIDNCVFSFAEFLILSLF
jgi:hypothetical protein